MGKLDRAVKKMGQEHKVMRRQLKRSVSATSAVAMLRATEIIQGITVIVAEIDRGIEPRDIDSFINELCARGGEYFQGGRAGWVCGNGYLDQQNRNQLLEWLDVVRDSAIKRIKAL